MKRVLIGDIHGRDYWLDVVNENDDADEFIFFGDYIDPYQHVYKDFNPEAVISDEELITNFQRIIDFKESNGATVKLLLGDRDLYYIADLGPCKAHSPKAAQQIRELFLSKLYLFDVVYQFDNVLCTHAGISEAWLNKYRQDWKVSNVSSIVKELFNEDYRYFHYNGTLVDENIATVGRIYESPFCLNAVDLTMYNLDLWKEYIQVFGHTRFYGIKLDQALNSVNNTRYYNVDTLWGIEPRYLSYQDGIFRYNRLERKL
jgi:hypothetical protein